MVRKRTSKYVTVNSVERVGDARVHQPIRREKLKKLQRGSVNSFISDNKQIKSLGVFDATRQEEIEKILQIRHLYTHQNGIIDEKFRKSFPPAKLNDEVSNDTR